MPADRGAARRAAERAGRWAEDWAYLVLRLKGYRILGRRLRTPVGEIDVLARRGAVLAVVEVKARRTRAEAVEALSPRQRHRLARAASAMLARRPDFATLALRFDVMVVTPWSWPRHISDAWRPQQS